MMVDFLMDYYRFVRYLIVYTALDMLVIQVNYLQQYQYILLYVQRLVKKSQNLNIQADYD